MDHDGAAAATASAKVSESGESTGAPASKKGTTSRSRRIINTHKEVVADHLNQDWDSAAVESPNGSDSDNTKKRARHAVAAAVAAAAAVATASAASAPTTPATATGLVVPREPETVRRE